MICQKDDIELQQVRRKRVVFPGLLIRGQHACAIVDGRNGFSDCIAVPLELVHTLFARDLKDAFLLHILASGLVQHALPRRGRTLLPRVSLLPDIHLLFVCVWRLLLLTSAFIYISTLLFSRSAIMTLAIKKLTTDVGEHDQKTTLANPPRRT